MVADRREWTARAISELTLEGTMSERIGYERFVKVTKHIGARSRRTWFRVFVVDYGRKSDCLAKHDAYSPKAVLRRVSELRRKFTQHIAGNEP